MCKSIKFSAYGIGLAFGIMLVVVQQATAVAIITDDGTGKTRAERYLLGYDFTVGATNQTVSALGIWDDSASDVSEGAPAGVASPDGLVEAHQVGLWRVSDGALLGSVTVPAGTGATLVGEFRYVTLGSPVTLLANTQYTLGAEYYGGLGVETIGQNGPDLWHDTQTQLNAGPAVYSSSADFNSFHARVDTTGAFIRPNQFSGGAGNAYIGANMLYGVPEPSSVTILAVGGMALGLIRRRRRV